MIKTSPKTFDRILDKFRELDYTGYSEQYPPFGSWREFKNQNSIIKKAWRESLLTAKDIGLFVNAPFCERKCLFCFLPVVCVGANKSVIDKFFKDYFKTLEKEAGFFSKIFKKKKFSTLYVGGGTPSLMPPERINEFFKLLKKKFSFKTAVQIVVEVHPKTLNDQKIRAFAANGVNRVCLGVQSMDSAVLSKIKREQKLNEVKKAFAVLKKNGINGINIDLICGLPGQNEKSFMNDLETIVNLKPDQIHVNSFMSTPYTPHSMLGGKKPDYKKIEEIRKKAFGFLKSANYIKLDSDSMGLGPDSKNFQTMDLSSKKSILGLGPGAISRAFGAIRYINTVNWKNYLSSVRKGDIPAERGAETRLRDEMIYFAIDKLSENGKLFFKNFKAIFKKDFAGIFREEIKFLEKFGAAIKKTGIKIPPKSRNIVRQAFYEKAAVLRGVKNIKLKMSFLKKF